MAWKLAAVISGSLASTDQIIPTHHYNNNNNRALVQEAVNPHQDSSTSSSSTPTPSASQIKDYKLRTRRLLESYDGERRPVAEANTRLSMLNYGKSERAAAALGVDPKVN